MKKKLSKVIIATLIVASSLMAGASEKFSDSTYSLVGIEGGYSSLDVDKTTGTSSSLIKYGLYNAGLKIGAQTDDYRVFLSARYYSNDAFDYLTTYGAELQYLLNVTSFANLFFGAGLGIANIRFVPLGEATRTLSDIYMSGDVGMNMHLGNATDLELGMKFLSLDMSNTISGVTYTFDSMITAYASIIFKFKVD